MNLLSKKTKHITFSVLDDDENGAINSLPDDMLEEILIRIPAEFLCKNVTLVSKRWRNIIETDIFWIEKGLRDEKFDKKVIQILQEKNKLIPKQLYFNSIFNKNLLKNPYGDLGFKYWSSSKINPKNSQSNYKKTLIDEIKAYKNSSSKNNSVNFKIEPIPIYSEKTINGSEVGCFVTSYTCGMKLQIIELDENFVENIQPKVEIQEFYTARRDCGSEYFLKVFIVNSKFEIIDSFNYDKWMPQWDDGEWKNVTHTFDFKEKFQYIVFYHAGKDTQFWAGNYGSKMTNGSVKIII